MKTLDFSKGDRVRVKGLEGVGKVVDSWHQPGTGTVVKVAFYSRSGRCVCVRTELADNVVK